MNTDMIERLKTSSPLDLPKAIIETELHDRLSAKDLFDEVNAQFDRESVETDVIMPVFTTIADSILDLKCFHGMTKKLGLTSSRIVAECRDFNYYGRISLLMPDSFAENRNQTDEQKAWADKNRPEYIRAQFENVATMGRYKKRIAQKSGQGKNIVNEYNLRKEITIKKDDPDLRRRDPNHRYNTETDHIIPLKRIFENIQGNAGLSDGDIRNIANQDCNFAVTSRSINNAKRDMTNSEFIKKQDRLKAEGKPYIELSPETRENMIRMEKEAQKEIDKSINSTVINNLTGKGNNDRAVRKVAIAQREQELGRKLTSQEREVIDRELSRNKAINIHVGNAKKAGKQGMMYALGNVVLEALKPLYYEVKDGFLYGFKEGVNATTYKEAFRIRFTRIKNYIYSQLCSLKNFLGNIMDALKCAVSALIEGLIGMFVGIFKKIFRLLKEGVKVFIEAWPVLFGKESKNKTAAQKGDAIIKILGGSAVALCGIGIDWLLDNYASMLPEWSRGAISTLITGLASALTFYALDRADLFNVKADKRNQRIDEIFQERINDIEESTNCFEKVATETLRRQTIEFNSIMNDIRSNYANEDIKSVNRGLLALSHFLGIPDSTPADKELDWNL